LNFKEYQKKAESTAVYPHLDEHPIVGIMYAALGLAGEAGEVADEVKKSWRNKMRITESRRENLRGELGDVCWYIALLCTELGLDMDEIAKDNLAKLLVRKEDGKLKHE
jgi:NTP pyrophosphatase (non-canonical NTP hydrolase)